VVVVGFTLEATWECDTVSSAVGSSAEGSAGGAEASIADSTVAAIPAETTAAATSAVAAATAAIAGEDTAVWRRNISLAASSCIMARIWSGECSSRNWAAAGSWPFALRRASTATGEVKPIAVSACRLAGSRSLPGTGLGSRLGLRLVWVGEVC